MIYVDKDGRWFLIDDLIISIVSFTVGYVSSGLTTGDWGWKSVEKGLITAGAAWLGYNTEGMSATAIWGETNIGIGYTLTAAGIGEGVGGASNTILSHYSDNRWRFNSYKSLNWTQVKRSVFAGMMGGLAGGAVGFYSGAPISAGIVGGRVSGGISGSYEGDWMGGAMLGMVSGGVSSGLTVAAYNIYGNYLYKNIPSQENLSIGDPYVIDGQTKTCRQFLNDVTDANYPNGGFDAAGFGPPVPPSGEQAHVGLVLGRTQYGQHMILSNEYPNGGVYVRTSTYLRNMYGSPFNVVSVPRYQMPDLR